MENNKYMTLIKFRKNLKFKLEYQMLSYYKNKDNNSKNKIKNLKNMYDFTTEVINGYKYLDSEGKEKIIEKIIEIDKNYKLNSFNSSK